MKYNYKKFIFSGFIFALLSACELYNPTEPIPAYIHIDKINVIKNPAGFTTLDGTEGSLSSKITDAWVYIDEQFIGCFELPVTFPVLYEGTHQLKIRAGIKVNGIAATRAPYPFYEVYTQTIDFHKTTKITVSPTVMYRTNAHFDLLENFESVGAPLIDTTSRSDTTLRITTTPPSQNVFEGFHSAIAYLDANRTFFECATVNKYVLPVSGADVFLEFNYKCNYPFTVSVIAYGTGSPFLQQAVLGLNASENWNKAYIYLTPTVSAAYTATNYKIAWGAINNTNTDSIAILLDNIKLVH